MASPLLLLQDIHVTFGNTALLDGAELSLSAGERLCLVGRNGSGKTTLLRVAAGLMEADRGSRFVQPGSTVRYLPQEPSLAGFADTHSAAVSVAALVEEKRIAAPLAVIPILAAITTNTISKMVFAVSAGGRSFALYVIPGLVLLVAAAWAGAFIAGPLRF